MSLASTHNTKKSTLASLALLASVSLLSASSLGAAEKSGSEVDLALFNEKALQAPSEIVDCTLTNGDAAQCAKLTLKYLPDDMGTGPFCPDTIEDVGGIWDWDGDNPGVYRLDKAFWEMLAKQGYTFYDKDGNIQSVDNASSPPTVDHACINVSADTEVKVTLLVPIKPVLAESASQLGTVAKVGVALAGVPIFADAPSVKDRDHLPALDTCAGHIDPGGWYHYHGTSSDINSLYKHSHVDASCDNLEQDSAASFGYGFDGVPMYGSLDADGTAPEDLDECNGHIGTLGDSDTTAYHYHSTNEFPNLPKCLKGLVAENNFVTTAKVGIGSERNGRGGPGGGMPPGFADAAKKLGVSESLFMDTLKDAGGPQADLAVVAEKLGVTEAALKAVLPKRPKR